METQPKRSNMEKETSMNKISNCDNTDDKTKENINSPNKIREMEQNQTDNFERQKLLQEVNSFYKKIHLHLKQKDNIRKLCTDIDQVLSNLKRITKLEDCMELETSFCDGANMNEVKNRHDEQMKQMNLNWWEKLDIYDVD